MLRRSWGLVDISRRFPVAVASSPQKLEAKLECLLDATLYFPPPSKCDDKHRRRGRVAAGKGLGARRGREQNVIIDREASRQAYKHLCDLIAIYTTNAPEG